MSNIFGKVERAVQTVKTISKDINDIDKCSESSSSNEYLRKLNEKEKEECKKNGCCEKKNEHIDEVIKKALNSNKIIPTLNRINITTKETVFKDVLFETFYKSLLLDEPFKEEYKSQLKALTDNYIDENGGMKLLTEAIEKSDSLLLKKIKTLCESIANEVCARKISECQNPDNDVNLIDFDMTDNEVKQLDYGKDNIDIDQIADLVKNKVLTVIRDEKTNQKVTSDTIDDIKNDIEELNDENEENESKTTESYEKFIIAKPLVETGTLFNALFRSTYRDFITENVAINYNANRLNEEHKEMSRNYDTETDVEDVSKDEVDGDPNEDIETSEINNDNIIESNYQIDMDQVLAETITKYTLMETLYSLKLENYTTENIRKLNEKLLNNVEVTTESSKSESENNDYMDQRSEFFKNINNLKDFKKIDKSKENIEKLYASLDKAEKKKYFNGFVATAIKEFETTKEKNPNLASKYDEIIEWLNGLK